MAKKKTVNVFFCHLDQPNVYHSTKFIQCNINWLQMTRYHSRFIILIENFYLSWSETSEKHLWTIQHFTRTWCLLLSPDVQMFRCSVVHQKLMPLLSPASCSSLESLESQCIKAFCGVLRSFPLLLISEDFVSSMLGTGDRGIFVYGLWWWWWWW